MLTIVERRGEAALVRIAERVAEIVAHRTTRQAGSAGATPPERPDVLGEVSRAPLLGEPGFLLPEREAQSRPGTRPLEGCAMDRAGALGRSEKR